MTDNIEVIRALCVLRHDIWVRDEYPKSVLDVLTSAIELLERSAAHEKVCAGTWVPVTERMPDWHDQVVVIDSEHVLHMSALQTGAGEREPYWIDEQMMDGVTHWLDVRLPTSGGE